MSKLGLGTVQFGTNYGLNSKFGKVQPKEVVKILNYAHSKNINYLDTAPSYGDSEKILGTSLKFDFRVITKTRHFKNNHITDKDLEFLSSDFNNSLTNLGCDSIYGLLVHNADDLLKPGAEKIIERLGEYQNQGKVLKLGVSVYEPSQLKNILELFEVDLVQLPLNILDNRMIETEMLTLLDDKGIEVHARSVFLQGLLLMDSKDRPKKFNRWKRQWNIWHQWLEDNKLTALEATIRYAVSFPEISRVLVGVDTLSQLEDIYKSSEGVLPDVPKELSTDSPELLNPFNWNAL
tara:strand:- start:111 stop:986 length:876 start_codon:yes stop_codon:yes gene_type:complete